MRNIEMLDSQSSNQTQKCAIRLLGDICLLAFFIFLKIILTEVTNKLVKIDSVIVK